MNRLARSPRIADMSWGRIRVEGESRSYKDAKLWPGGAVEWDWRDSGTHHSPGIQPDDVVEILEHGATTVVLSQGYLGRLQVDARTMRMLRGVGIKVHVLPTEPAVELYNSLRKTERVGGLIHSTC